MKYLHLLSTIFLLLSWRLSGQAIFTRIIDSGNPAVSYVNTAGNYKGAVWVDLNQDNLPDLFASQKFLFLNQGNGNFTQLADVAGATTGQAASGSSWADLDNDGDLDCITASTVSGLHYNNGDNTFSLRNNLLPAFENYRAWDCSIADADNNGLLDLFFAHADNFPPGSVQQPCKFYLQVSKDSFQLVLGNEFAVEYKPYTIPVWTDFDMDGDMDLLIGSGPGGAPGPDFCYRNMLKENGVFSLQRLSSSPFNSMQDGQVYNAIDYDNDGDQDICLTNYSGATTRFYKREASGYTAVQTPFTTQSPYLSNAWGDLDNDGDLDVLISSDGNANLLFFQNNNAVFAPSVNAGAAGNAVCGIVLADYDNDGDLDVYTNGATEARALFRNAGNSNHWAAFCLQGVQSNRSAIGARLRVKALIQGQSVWQTREVNAHNSFQGQHDLRQHFGLGEASIIDSLEVQWPSGLVQKFSGLVANNFYKIVENQAIVVITSATSEIKPPPFSLKPNPVSRHFEVLAKEDIVYLELYDSTGKQIAIRQEISENKAAVQLLGNPPAGNYFVRVSFKGGAVAVQGVMVI